jgi:DNA-binding PadR family transcriptional regulator
MAGSKVSARYLILGLLTQQARSAYGIKRLIRDLNWLVGTPSFGTLYPALRALQQEGLVTVDHASRQDGHPKKIYCVTQAGREALREWSARPMAPEPSLKTFVLRLVLADNLSLAGLVSLLHQRRAQVADNLAALEDTTQSQDRAIDLGQRLTLEYGSALARAELVWLESMLNRLSGEPLPVEVVRDDRILHAS